MNKEDLNLLVPFGYSEKQPEREDLLHFVVENCIHKQTHPNFRLVLVESGEHPTQEQYAKSNCDQYIFLHSDRDALYSAGFVQNEGFRQAKTAKRTYLHQADFILPPDMVEIATDIMDTIEAPFVFPFFSSMNLSHPLTEAIVSGHISWMETISALEKINSKVREETHRIGIVDRKYLSDEELIPLIELLPPTLQIGFLQGLNVADIWGKDDGNFTYFGDSFKVNAPSETLLKYRPGGRAKASYLANSKDYDIIGGSPNYVGWGYEDLGFWARAQAVYDYKRSDDGEMRYMDKSTSTNYPIVHLWHSTASNGDYFAMTDVNRKLHEAYLNLPQEEQVSSLVPIGRY